MCTTQFKDVNVLDTYYRYIRDLGCSNIVEGYACGGVGEPCFCDNYPYFRPGSTSNRDAGRRYAITPGTNVRVGSLVELAPAPRTVVRAIAKRSLPG